MSRLLAFDSLFRLDARGFAKGFTEIPRQYPDSLHQPNEGYYKMALLIALSMAGHRCQCQGSTGGGRYDFYLKSPAGDHLIIEMRCIVFGRRVGDPNASDPSSEAGGSEEAAERRRRRAESEANRRRKMAKAARTALSEIKARYAAGFSGGPKRVYQVALVVGGRDDVLAEMEEYTRRARRGRLSPGAPTPPLL